jgi:triphosphatase
MGCPTLQPLVARPGVSVVRSEETERAREAAQPEPARSLSHLECELKLEGSSAELEAAFASIAADNAAPARTMLSIYFDTPGGALWASGRNLRVRKSQGKYVQTLKWSDEGIRQPDTRHEIEVACDGSEPDIELFGPQVAAELQEVSGGVSPIARFSAQFKRKVAKMNINVTEIEAALDVGHIIDGSRQLPLREIELELKSGDPADLYQFAEQLSAAYNLRLGVLTKSQRGFLLAAGETAAIRKAKAPDTAQDATIDDLIAIAITECIDHFIGNWPALLQSDNPDAIHQMRVGIRRLRSLLAAFHKEIPAAAFVAFRKEAREIASALGVARDTDVFIKAADEGPFAAVPEDNAIEAFREGLRERRDEGYGQAHAMLAAPQTTRFVLEMRAFVARRSWRDELSAEQLIGLGAPAAKFAARTLERLHKKARKRGDDIENATAEEVHALRIVLKNVRYCSEMFSSMFHDRNGVKKYLKSAGRLQDVLGAHNDSVVSGEIVADVERRAGPVASRAAGLVTGWTARGLQDSGASLRDDFQDFKKAERFWR